MKRALGLGWAVMTAAAFGCAGPAGPAGKEGPQGTPGMPGTGTPSVSAVTPAFAFLGRTVDLSIAGSGTTWSDKTTVTFADPKVTVNKVTAASASGLLVNVTIDQDATISTTDVTVSDSGTMAVYKGAFEIKAPLVVTTDQMGGVPQGGLATVHVVMLDLTTPFDADTAMVTVSSPDLGSGQPNVTDYVIDFAVEADVLAKVGSVDLDVTSGTGATLVHSQAKAALSIAARAPTTLTSAAAATGMIANPDDTALYEYTPASAAQRFVQFTVGSMAGAVSGTVIPKSGAYADALDSDFAVRFGQGVTSTDPFYVVVSDSQSLFGAGPTPADLSLVAFDAACTAETETAETAAANNNTYQTAQAVAALPALVSGTLGYVGEDPTVDVDFYAITVAGAPKKIHVATGGDPANASSVAVYDSTGLQTLGVSPDDDVHQDLVVDVMTNGTYYVAITASSSMNVTFDPTHNTYELFIEVK